MRYMTAGESHNKGLIGVIEGLPAGIEIDEKVINNELKLRQGGYGRGKRMEFEQDTVDIISGIRMGKTMGSPVSLYIRNKDWDNYEHKFHKEGLEYYTPRPGHADLPGMLKYKFSDSRNVLERASARETAMRVAIGSICQQFLNYFKIKIYSHVKSLGAISIRETGDFEDIYKSPLYCLDKGAEEKMIELIDTAKAKGDSLGGTVETIITNLPPGLGDYTHYENRLDSRLAGSIMSIPSVKGVEIGVGFSGSHIPGSLYHDCIFYNEGIKRVQNNAGGIEGGMTNGEHVVLRAVIKPIPTLKMSLGTFNTLTKENCKTDYQRSDTTVVPAASVVVKNVVAIEIAKAILDKFAGDHIDDTLNTFTSYLKRIEEF
ncbi:chorismate synthase [Alkalicella caledoniensis]|uniref:Chorismate synthase n=1 Tax=Alkalicella caledoniensis TaxID=2731377 RepID=A0A7G9WCB4_ALKCA|nr:chorismate synthase [Alkalicella caledoniensis]QNO16326.1 chorismate synthase [Alkalicella caledoniensis]